MVFTAVTADQHYPFRDIDDALFFETFRGRIRGGKSGMFIQDIEYLNQGTTRGILR